MKDRVPGDREIDVVTRHEPNLLQLGRFIRERRLELGLTQVELAQRLGWAQARMSTLENGKYGMPSLLALSRLSTALDAPLVSLIAASGQAGTIVFEQPDRTMLESTPVVLHYTLQRLLTIEAVELVGALNEASDVIAEAMGADKVDAFMFDPDTKSLIALGTSNTPMGRLQHDVGLHISPVANRGRTVEVYETGEPYYTGRADQDREIEIGITETLGVRSMIAVPLRIEGKTAGVFVATSAESERFSVDEREFFLTTARWVGSIAWRAQLVEATKRSAVESARRLAAEELITVLAHDLGNLITPLRGQLDLIVRRAHQEGHQRNAHDASMAAGAAARMQHIVSDLLDTARLDRGFLALAMQPCDLVRICVDEVSRFQPMRPALGLRAPDHLPVQADPSRLAQVVENLIANAIRHTPDGTPVRVEVSTLQGDDRQWAVVEVHDEGPGIAPELLPTLFQRFVVNSGSPGLGLGLYISRQIVEAHGGTVEVHSMLGEGSRFRVCLPIQSSVDTVPQNSA